MQLTKDQQRIYDLIEKSNKNFLITGKPGTGKSVLTRALLTTGQKNYVVAAPTGLAALNAMGRTLHSIFRIPISDGIIEPDFNQFTNDEKTINYIRYGIKSLIIDEISMVRADTLDYIDRLLKMVKGNEQPFGGVQMIFIGDFHQLPPVTNKFHQAALSSAGYESPFAFDALAWLAADIQFVELTEVLRQKGDLEFMAILDGAREGIVSTKQMLRLNKQVEKTDGLRIILCGVNKDADAINFARLRSIQFPTQTFFGVKFGEWPALPVDEVLNLKVGAQVMVKVNRADRPPGTKGEFESKIVNGTLGVVEEIVSAKELEQNPDAGHQHVKIKLEDGTIVPIYSKRWERKVRFRNDENKWEEKVVASYEQIPLALAWAISMHKSQGQTFEKVHIDANRIFAAGQLYVALSRCRTLNGVSLERPLKKEKFWANRRVQKFMEDQLNILI